MTKYSLPWTHELAQSNTWLDIAIEWWEDYYDRNPKELRSALADEDGEYYFSETGDDQIDKWEREMALGLTPDLEEGLPTSERDKLKKERERYAKARKQMDDIMPTERVQTKEEKRYASKFAVPGSPEEKRLMGRGANDGWVDLLGDMKNG